MQAGPNQAFVEYECQIYMGQEIHRIRWSVAKLSKVQLFLRLTLAEKSFGKNDYYQAALLNGVSSIRSISANTIACLCLV